MGFGQLADGRPILCWRHARLTGQSGFRSNPRRSLLRTDQLRGVVMGRFERHLVDDPLFVVIVGLIDPPPLLPNTQSLNFVVVAAA